MFLRLLVLFIAMPLLELAVLVELGRNIGFWPTIGIVVLTGLIGSILARRQGLAVWHQFNLRLQRGELPGTELIDGLIVLVSGAFLLTPGVITDFLGFAGLLPMTRGLIRRYVQHRLEKAQQRGTVRMHVNFSGNMGRPPSHDRAAVEHDIEWEGTPRERPVHGDDAR